MERVEREDAEFKSVSPDVVMETTPAVDGATVTDQEDIHPSPDSNQMPVVETQDSSEESRVGIAVDEQEAGPSGLPVEWQGATVVRPKSRLKTYDDRAFSVDAPSLWNQLPFALRSVTSVDQFKTQLKTYLFKLAYDV